MVNCATMRADRLEVELFGSESLGDGADGPTKVGTLEQAHGGTLLLDEVADMPLETQGKIVRVLQEQTFERVGGATRVEVDVRVIASTNRDLAEEMQAGRFRQDLFYRLNVVPIRVPPPARAPRGHPAAGSIISCAARRRSPACRRAPSADDALAVLQAYDWPGNVRQLRNVVDWLLIMAPGEPGEAIRADMLPPDIGAIAPSPMRGDDGLEMMSLPLREAREVFERALSRCPGQPLRRQHLARPRPSSAWSARRCIASCGRWGSRRAIGRSGAKAERKLGEAAPTGRNRDTCMSNDR